MTALMYAAQGGHLNVVKLLIEKRANVHIQVSNDQDIIDCFTDNNPNC